MLSLGRIIVGIIIMILVLPILSGLCTEYCVPSVAKDLNTTGNTLQGNFINQVYNPLSATTGNGLNQSNNLAQASAQFGFVFAFILPSFGSFVTTIIQAPKLMVQVLVILLGNFGLAGLPTQAIIAAIFTLMTTYLFILGLQTFMKTPIWG